MIRIEKGQIGDTVRIRRPPKVVTDELGRNVWMGRVAPCLIELEFGATTDPYDNAESVGWPITNIR